MTLVSVQCPNCGSPVDAPRIGATVRCPSCGSALTINQGASGFPMAQLATIGRDTGFLARQQAVERLTGQLRALQTERAGVDGELRKLTPAQIETSPVRIPWRWVGALFLAGVLAGTLTRHPLAAIVPCLMGFVVLVVYSDRQVRGMTLEPESERVAGARAQLEQRVAELDSEIRSDSADLARVEADLDRMAHEF